MSKIEVVRIGVVYLHHLLKPKGYLAEAHTQPFCSKQTEVKIWAQVEEDEKKTIRNHTKLQGFKGEK